MNSRRGQHWLSRVSDRHLTAAFVGAASLASVGTVLVVVSGLHQASTALFVAGLIIAAGAFVVLGIKRSAIPISLAMAITVVVAAALALAPAESVPRWIVMAPAIPLAVLLVLARRRLW